MRSLVNKIKNCDGAFCERVAELGFAFIVLAIMIQSISQIV